MTLPQDLTRAMRQAIAEYDDLQPEDAPTLGAAVEVFRRHLAREDARASKKRTSSGAAMRPRRPSEGIPAANRDAVERRSNGWCEIAHLNCSGRATEVHHRLMRSQGGGHDVDNLLHLCGAGHRFVHDNPEHSYGKGWLLHRVTA